MGPVDNPDFESIFTHDLGTIPPEMKIEILSHADLKGVCRVAKAGRKWHQIAMGDVLWRIFASKLGMATQAGAMNPNQPWVPVNVTVRGHVITIGKVAQCLVERVPSGENIDKAKKILSEGISIGNTVALEACLVRRWVSMVSRAKQPAFVGEFTSQEFSVENNRQIKEWLEVRDIFTVWKALIEQCSLQDNLPELNSFETLEDAKTAAGEFRQWCLDNQETLLGLRELNLRWVHLTTVPEEIGLLQNLQKLDLACNLLTRLPDSIGNLTNLIEVNLGSNYFTVIPDCIFRLSELEHLDMSKNSIVSVPQRITSLTKLNYLSFTDNCLEEVPNCIGQLRDLQQLHLGINALSDLPDSIRNLAQLTELGLYSNQFATQPAVINVLPSLRRISLFSNPLPVQHWNVSAGVTIR